MILLKNGFLVLKAEFVLHRPRTDHGALLPNTRNESGVSTLNRSADKQGPHSYPSQHCRSKNISIICGRKKKGAPEATKEVSPVRMLADEAYA